MEDDVLSLSFEELMGTEELKNEVIKMNSFGARLTGNVAHNNYVAYLRKQIEELGYTVYSDTYRFKRWEEKSSSLVIHGDNGEDVSIKIASAYPYSGYTSAKGVTGELNSLITKRIGFITAISQIAVVKVGDVVAPADLVMNDRHTYPEGIEPPQNYHGPVPTSFANLPFLKFAKLMGVKAVICIWKGFSKEMVEGQYLPFIMDYQGIPAVWINEEEGKKVISAAKKHRRATLTLECDIEPHAETSSLYVIQKGEDPSEAIIVNTHTDGTNCIEENGPIALIAMMKFLKDKKPKRSIIYLFMTGHFRLPAIKTPMGVQATTRWLNQHKDLWDGKRSHIKAVAGITIEHLGAREWWDDSNKCYKETNPIEYELCYTGNKKVDDIYLSAMKGRTLARTVTLRGHNFLHFGEGQPLFDVGIPTISLVAGPSYLCVVSKSHEMEKFDENLMREQIITCIRALYEIDKTPTSELGKSDGYSLLFKAK